MTRVWILLGLLCAAGAAWADPFSAVAALSTFAGAAAGGATFLGLSAGAWFYVGVAASVLGAANSRRKARKAQAAAKAEYNAGLQDRTATVLRTDPPWQVVYGRCIVGGFYSDIITTDKVQPNEVSDAATKPDAYKTGVVVMAAHEVEAFHEVYIDGIPVGPVDVDGWAANGASATVTFTHGSDLVNWTATPATDGVGFMLYGGTAPTGLVNNTLYYVRDKTADSFKLAATPGGAPINFTSDGSGTITGRIQSPFFSEVFDARIRTFTDELTFTEGPLIEVLSAYYGDGDAQTQVTVTIESGNRLVSAVPDVEVTVNFSFTKDKPTVRVGYFYGAASQTTPAMLAEIAPSRYTSDHRLRGCAGVIVTLDLEDVRFQGGPPQITADLSGRLLYDPRDDSTAWSDNPALVVRDFLTAEWGFEVDEADVDDNTVATAADACDELIDLVVGSTTTEDQPRFTCNGAFQTDAAKESTLADLVDSMGGAVSYGATYRLLAGTWTAPVMALTDDDLHGQIEVVQADTPTGELFNGIRGQLFLPGAQSPSDFNPYQNSTFAADDGRDLWTSTALPYTNHLARARNLSRIAVEQTRSGQVIRYPAKMLAWPLEIGDRVTVTSAEYGLTTKAYRVTDWQWDTTSPVVLTLQEDAEEIYDLADAAVADPTPNTGLADPWAVPALDNVDATSGNSTLVMQGDGTIVPRVLVTWDAVANGGVSAGGRVEVLWRSQSATAWNFYSVPGADTSVYLYGCTVGDTIIIEARARNSLSRVGPSVYLSHVVAGKTDAPGNVIDFAYAIKPGQVALTWDECPDDDYEVTEIRVGASWAAGTFGWAGKASERNIARPPNGTYELWAAHKNRSGIYSDTPAYLSVVVDDSIDSGGGGDLVLEVDGPPIFRFADGTTHTTADPDLTFTARLINLYGEADWAATAYSAMTGGTNLGAVTLTGTGNARVMTGAAFVAPGTSGSVRRVDVVASIGAASDTQTVYRYDPTVTDPFLYLSNPNAAVSTDEAGDYGDYSRATTAVAVLDTGSDVTSAWSIAIEPDAGLTATINAGAGPVTGTADVDVAVSASTIPDGVVLIRASKSGETDLTAPFRIVKRPAQSVDRLLYFAPRTDIVLPVDASGAVTSYVNAWTNAMVRLKSGIDATDQYTFTKTDENVTSTLVGNKISITAWVPLGTFGTTVSVTPGVGSTGWERPAPVVIFGDGVWVQPGLNTNIAAPFSVARRSTDYETWDDVALGVTEHWSLGSFTGNAFVLANNSNSNQVLRSTDGGLTYSVITLPVTNAFQHVRGQAGTFFILPNGHTTAMRSTDAGATFSSVTVPSGPFDLWGVGINRWLFKNSSTGYSISTDNGGSWSSTSPPAALKSAIGFRGLIVAAYTGASSSVAYSEDAGATWANATLPASVTDGRLLNIRGVLYLYGSALIHYSLDGKRWAGSGATVTSSDCWCVSADEIDTDIFPLLNNLSGIWAAMPMLATAATEGAVHVTASKAGEDDLTATLPVQLGAVVSPPQVSNINPAVAMVQATADGVVTDISNASFEVTVVESSVTVTSDYAWAWTATHLTPSSGTGATATFTAMDDAYDSGRVSFVGTQAGKDPVRLGADVVKLKGTDDSGIVIGAAYNISSVTNTYVEIRLTSTGVVQQREGSGGSFVRIGQWSAPEGASAGAGAWVRFDVLNTPDGTSTVTGTTGSFLALTSDRGISLSDTSSGTHKVELVVYLSPNSGGTLPRASLVTLLLIVP